MYFRMLRGIGGVLIVVSFVLPLSTCQIAANPDVTHAAREKVTNYGYSYVDLNDMGSWLFPLAFFWPIPVLFFRRRINTIIQIRVISMVEVLLCIYSGYLMWVVGELGDPQYGFFVAIAGIGLYIFTVVVEMVKPSYYDGFTP